MRPPSLLSYASLALPGTAAWSLQALRGLADAAAAAANHASPADPSRQDAGPSSDAPATPSTSDRADSPPSRPFRPSRWHYVRISASNRRAVETWTPHDVLTFLQDASVRLEDLGVEFDRRLMKPVAWWVRYLSDDKAESVTKHLVATRLGTTEVYLQLGDSRKTLRDRSRGLMPAGGRSVLLETEQPLDADKVETWFEGFHLSDTSPRFHLLFQAREEGADGASGDKRPASRAIVTFSDAAEAQRAAWRSNNRVMGDAHVRLRVLPWAWNK